MKKIELTMTQAQYEKLDMVRVGMGSFGLITMPVISSRKMKVLVLSDNEFRKARAFFNKFVPKKLKTNA